jgi:hypothetical protein
MITGRSNLSCAPLYCSVAFRNSSSAAKLHRFAGSRTYKRLATPTNRSLVERRSELVRPRLADDADFSSRSRRVQSSHFAGGLQTATNMGLMIGHVSACRQTPVRRSARRRRRSPVYIKQTLRGSSSARAASAAAP